MTAIRPLSDLKRVLGLSLALAALGDAGTAHAGLVIKADGTTANDATALANLPAASAFPISPTNLQFSSANGRAVGLNTPPLSTVNGVPGVFDGVVTLNSSQPFQFDRTGGIAPTNFDAMRVIEHEIDEVLGLFSTLPDGRDFAGAPAVSPEDLFRYSAPGTISFTNSGSASSYFSIDGGLTSIVGLNQDPAGDYGDWLGSSTVARVQAAFIGHAQADISATSPEGIALDVIGYDAVPVPEPSAVALYGIGLSLLCFCRRWVK